MKKFVSFVLVICLMLALIPASALATETELQSNDTIKYSVAGGTITITKDGTIIDAAELLGSVYIPSVIEGVTVKEIALLPAGDTVPAGKTSPFEDCTKMTMLNLPGTIKTIAAGTIIAENLLSVTLNNGTETLETGSIISERLATLIIPDSVSTIEAGFSNSDVARVTISGNNPYFSMDNQGIIYDKTMKKLIAYASERANHPNITIPAGVTEIGFEAFANSRGSDALKSISLEGDVEIIGGGAFIGSNALTRVAIPENIVSIGDYAFAECRNLETVGVVGSPSFGIYTFGNCEKLRDIVLTDPIERIPAGMFAGTSMRYIPYVDSVKEIGAEAFMSCPMAATLHIPADVERIGENAFAFCSGIANLSFDGRVVIASGAFKGIGLTGRFSVPKDVKFEGSSHFAYTDVNEIIIDESIFVIGDKMFDGCKNVTSIRVPATLVSMANILGDDAYKPEITTIIYGYEGTSAQIYAKENRLIFVPLGRVEMSFIDVYDHWAKADIEWTYLEGLFGGTTSTTFSPEEKMTRAMIATVLFRSSSDEVTEIDSGFTDVRYSAYYRKAVDWAKDAEIISGVSETLFGGARNVTREQLVAMLFRYAEHIGKDTSKKVNLNSFADYGKISDYATPAFKWAVAEGIIKGSGDMLHPTGNATRAEVAAMLHRFFLGAPEEPEEPEEPEDTDEGGDEGGGTEPDDGTGEETDGDTGEGSGEEAGEGEGTGEDTGEANPDDGDGQIN